jgi:hypothetical protein
MSGDPGPRDLGDPQTLNRYAYARNNPVNLTDPTGLFIANPTEYGDYGGLEDNTGGAIVGIRKIPGCLLMEPEYAAAGMTYEVQYCEYRYADGPKPQRPVATQPSSAPAPAPSRPAPTPAQAQSPQCAQTDFLQRVGIAAQAFLARVTGLNIGVGVGGSGAIGHILGAAGSLSRQMVVSPNGQAAIVTTFAATTPPFGLVEGGGVFGGLQFSIGSATSSLAELGSPAVVASFGGGNGWGAGLDVAGGPSGWQATVTGGAGAGLEGAGGAALVAPPPVVTPMCAP